ncbi:hypothetical protein B0H21DRAFT_271585 [Amylocystis lapponica]|nr:hypothetical protein B0H21DRAFT_271585 [Amylocystis lapponica]
MCHRQLRFIKMTGCGHLQFTGDTTLDCNRRDCFISSAHPPNCANGQTNCRCRRYYTQPERITTSEQPGKCNICL